MNFIISASTDVGITKDTNEDSVFIRRIKMPSGEAVLGVVCDGVGGLNCGEIASGSVVVAMDVWFREEFPTIYLGGMKERVLFQSWLELVQRMNIKIGNFGKRNGVRLGTTLVAFLIVDDIYYIVNVGDSRVYELTDHVNVLTHDQTLVYREVELGLLTQEEAQNDPRGNVILQCIGESDRVLPEFLSGPARLNAVYMACSDGFRHKITESEILLCIGPKNVTEYDFRSGMEHLIQLNINRNETDNISVIAARTYAEVNGDGKY